MSLVPAAYLPFGGDAARPGGPASATSCHTSPLLPQPCSA